MKKAICFFVLFFAVSGVVDASDPYNYAERWNSWANITKNAYLDGLTDGIVYGSTQSRIKYTGTNKVDLKSKDFQKFQKALQETVLYFENDSLIKVIDELYRDSSNCFIAWHEIAVISRDKLKGKSIEKSLIKARQLAIQLHDINERQKTK